MLNEFAVLFWLRVGLTDVRIQRNRLYSLSVKVLRHKMEDKISGLGLQCDGLKIIDTLFFIVIRGLADKNQHKMVL